MLRYFSVLSVCASLCVWFHPVDARAVMRDDPHITVLAAIGAETPLVRIVRSYSRDNHLAASVTFSSVVRQFKDIEEGKSADVMITAHPKWTQTLKQMGVADVNSINNMMRDDLVIAVARTDSFRYEDAMQPADFLRGLLKKHKPVFIADDTISALGLYTKQAFDRALSEENGMPDDRINPLLTQCGYVRMPSELPEKIVSQNAAAVMYASTLSRYPELRALYEIPQQYYDDIIYQVAVIAGENMEDARDLARFLAKDETLKAFYAEGFRPL